MPRDPSALQIILDELREFRSEVRENRGAIEKRLSEVESDIKGAKLVGRVSLGVAVAMGSFVTWATDMVSWLKSSWPGASH